jgi:glutamate racemase
MKSGAPIGVFDSGVGGITVLKPLLELLPQEKFIYFGDLARVPYGNRSPGEIKLFASQTIHWMKRQNVKMIIVACNTSCAVAADVLQAESIVMNLIEITAQAIANQYSRIGVIATNATAKSNAYKTQLQRINPSAEVFEIACPELVPLIEAGLTDEAHAREVLSSYLQPLISLNIDSLIYGCTHYPILAPMIRRILPAHIELIDPARYIAGTVSLTLTDSKQCASDETNVKFYISAHSDNFAKTAQQWLGFEPQIEVIDITEGDLLRHPGN